MLKNFQGIEQRSQSIGISQWSPPKDRRKRFNVLEEAGHFLVVRSCNRILNMMDREDLLMRRQTLFGQGSTTVVSQP
jgi:hypothetical protein